MAYFFTPTHGMKFSALMLIAAALVAATGSASAREHRSREVAREFQRLHPCPSTGQTSGEYALQESVRQMRGIAPAQIPGAKISVCHGVGGMFAASGTIIMSNEPP
jgi:hypothetical protein